MSDKLNTKASVVEIGGSTMNMDHLKMFCLVVDEGSISQAARSSYVSQPAVTNQMRQLENYYGTDLFNRRDGRVTLTEAGEKLYPFAKEMIDHLERSEEAIKSMQDTYESTLHIGASLTIGEYFLPQKLGEFQRKHKTHKTSVFIGNTPDVITKLTNLDIDIALVEGVVENKECSPIKYAEDELILVVAKDHPWASRDAVDIQEIPTEKFIWREENASIRKIIHQALQKHHVSTNIISRMELGSTQAIKSAVEAGLGISILPKLSVKQELAFGQLIHVPIEDVKIMRDLFIVKKRSRFPKQTVNDFITFLTKDTK